VAVGEGICGRRWGGVRKAAGEAGELTAQTLPEFGVRRLLKDRD
jgi:hypothetical protein